MAEDYTLTTNEEGQAIYRDTEGRTLSPGDYASTYSPAVMQDMGIAPGGGGGGGIASLANTSLAPGSFGDAPAYRGDSTGVAAQVDALYQNVFNRPADVAGLQYFGNALMSGASVADIERSLRASAEFAGLQPGAGGTVGGTIDGTVGGTGGTTGAGKTETAVAKTIGDASLEGDLAKYYTSEFGRAFDKPGLDFWAGKIRSGEVALGDVAKIFSTSPEGLKYDIANLAAGKTDQGFVDPSLKGRYETVQDLYKKETYRPGDMPGLEYWLGRNLTSEQYAKAFAESPEARVQDAYREVFGPTRGADEKGLKYYMDELASGKKYEDIVKAMKASEEYKILTGVAKPPVVVKPPVVNPVTGVTYSNASQSAKAVNFGNFPLTSGTRVNEKGEVVPSVSLNLKARPKFNLGLPGFSTLGLTSYQENPASTNVFGRPGATGTAAATTDQGVVTAAQGGMIMSDPVMRRAMFRNGGPVSSKGYGITSNVTTPDENAMAMQTMFQPQGFRDGGPVQYFQEGGEAEAVEEPAPLTPIERLRAQTRTSEPRFKSVMDVYREGRMLPIDREQEYTGRSMRGENPVQERPGFRPKMENMGPDRRAAERRLAIDDADERAATAGPPGGIAGFFGSVLGRTGEILSGRPRSGSETPSTSADRRARLEAQAADQMAEYQAERMAAEDQSAFRGAAAPAAARREEQAPAERKAPVKDRLTLRLDELKAERQANKAQRRENQLLALMQAGFAAASGRSPNALANIAAGGASGVATLADLEKGRRAEDTALRREILETELAGERTRETAAERQAAREEREFSRQTLGLRAEQDLNARYAIAANAEKRQLNEIIGDNTGKFSEEKKREAAAQLTVLEQDLRVRRLKEERLSQALLPPSMREESGGFRASLVGSPRPTSQR